MIRKQTRIFKIIILFVFGEILFALWFRSADFKERENELTEHLELITNIAQRIDSENRALQKKNAELNIEYISQDKDRDLLVKYS